MFRQVFISAARKDLAYARFNLNSRKYAGYLSEDFKATMEYQFESPKIERKMMKTFAHNDNLLPFQLEAFVASISLERIVQTSEDRRDELYEKLIQLRRSPNFWPQTLNHGVVNYLLTLNTDDLLTVVANKLRYGIFIDAFTGCYLMNILLEKKDFKGGVNIAAELMLQEENNDLVKAFSLLCTFEFVKNNFEQLNIKPTPKTTEKKTQDKVKQRVKFVRNPIENQISNVVDSKLIANIFTHNIKDGDKIVKHNGHLVASVIKNDFGSLDDLFNEKFLCKDVAEVCLNILEKTEDEDPKIQNIKDNLEKVRDTTSQTYSSILEQYVKTSINNLESDLITERKKLYAMWLSDRNEKFANVYNNQAKLLVQEQIQKELDHIDTKKQELWFFQKQDQLDMEIFRKQVRYPKRWFGKKKKPRMVDDNYVPPEIRSKL